MASHTMLPTRLFIMLPCQNENRHQSSNVASIKQQAWHCIKLQARIVFKNYHGKGTLCICNFSIISIKPKQY
uniref:Uncharacterized protein n=1 Tax=Rhizophora mucronata TaxID=61149 RepID=A0A2P2J352_RHIMU